MLWDQDSGKHSCPLTCCGSPAHYSLTSSSRQSQRHNSFFFLLFFSPKVQVRLNCRQIKCSSALSSVRRLGRRRGFRLQPGGWDQLPDSLQLLCAPIGLQEHSWGPYGPRRNTRCSRQMWSMCLLLLLSFIFNDLLTQLCNKIWNSIHTFYLQLYGTQMSKFKICLFLKNDFYMVQPWISLFECTFFLLSYIEQFVPD